MTARLIRLAMGGAALASALAPAAARAQTTDIGTVTTGPGDAIAAPPAPGTASEVAPSYAPLAATQPTSVVGSTFIRNAVVPTENYDDIIKFAPSVQNIEPVGAGLQQNFAETIRGFNYTQFNTTFDGIVLPGLPTNFAPQSEAYFLAHDIGSVEVDRGPGTASTIGYATFGGTVSILSKEPSDTFLVNPYGTYGSFDTKQYGVEVDTGSIASLNGAKAMIDIQRVDADGYLNYTTTQRTNVFFKGEAPIGDNTLLTAVAMYDNDRNHTPYGATLAQYAAFGPSYQFTTDPNRQSFYGYNVDNYHTDFEYLKLKSDLGDGWSIEDTLYTNGYYQNGATSTDPNGTTPNLNRRVLIYADGFYATPFRVNNAVPGYDKHNDFRDYGNILRFSKETDIGELRFGAWADGIVASSYRPTVLLNYNYLVYSRNAATPPYSYLYNTTLLNLQPYAEFAFRPIDGLEITPGIRYTRTERTLDATYNRGTGQPAQFDQLYEALQPSVQGRYSFNTSTSVYAQAAKGYLAPPLNVLYVSQPSDLSPNQTWNYQTGATYHTDALSLTGDLYYIDFKNIINSQTIAGNTTYFNGGSAVYKGVEFEGTVRVGGGVSLYGNYSLNDAYYNKRNQASLPLVPRYIGAAGAVLQRHDVLTETDQLYASVIGKFVGPQFGAVTTSFVDQFAIRSYAYADAALSYTFPIQNRRELTAKVNFNNIFDDHSVIFYAGATGAGVPLYWLDPGRSVFVTLSATL